jgi:hypothetical protein
VKNEEVKTAGMGNGSEGGRGSGGVAVQGIKGGTVEGFVHVADGETFAARGGGEENCIFEDMDKKKFG